MMLSASMFDKVIARPPGADRCDLCKTGKAVCDAPTRHGPWGYLCESCFARHGRAGVGYLFR